MNALPSRLLGLLTLPLLLCACGRSDPPRPVAPTPAVTVQTVAPRDEPVVREFLAQAQSSRQVNIQARVNGFLEKREYTEGGMVKAGQLMFTMEDKGFVAQLNQARAALAQAEAGLEPARSNLVRTKSLAGLNALAPKDLDNANSQYQAAVAAVEQAKAQVESAQINLSYTRIYSPVTGMAGAAAIADGSYVNSAGAGQLTTVSVMSPMWVNFSVAETDYLRLRSLIDKGELRAPEGGKYTVDLILSDGAPYPYKGSITFASPSYDAQTGTFLVRISVDNPDGVLRPNQYLRARLRGATRPHAILLPLRAIHEGPHGHFVWVVDAEKHAQSRPVNATEWSGDLWNVADGLKAGESVIVDGGTMLQPGQLVEPSAAGTAANKPAK